MDEAKIEEFKAYIAKELEKLGKTDFTWYKIVPALMRIICEAFELVIEFLDYKEKRQITALVTAVDELLEEIDLPFVDGALEDFIEDEIVLRLPALLKRIAKEKASE